MRRSLVFPFLGILFGFMLLAFSVYLVQAAPVQQTAANGKAIFDARCAGCHSIGGGKLVGPDLAGVTTRRDPAWIKQWLSSTSQMLKTDPVAKQLLAEYGSAMPDMGLQPGDIDALIAFFQSTGQGTTAPAAPAVITLGNRQNGQALFSGQVGLFSGGTPCIACHTVTGVGSLAGGSLGPDLTHVQTRLTQAGLDNALATLPFPTMQNVFLNKGLTPTERADILAYLAWADATPVKPVTQPTPLTLFFGLGSWGAVVLFGLLYMLRPHEKGRSVK